MDWQSLLLTLLQGLTDPATAATQEYFGFALSTIMQWLVIGLSGIGAFAVSPLWRATTISEKEQLNNAFRTLSVALPGLMLAVVGRAIFEAAGHKIELLDFATAGWATFVLWRLVGVLGLERRPTLLIRLGILALVALMFTDRWNRIVGFLSGFSFKLGQFHLSLWSVSKAAIAVAIVLWAASHGNKFLVKTLANTRLQPAARTLIVKLINIVAVIIAGLVGLDLLGIDFAALAVFGGAFGLGLGFGMRSIISNYVAGIILLLDRSLKPGDVIEVEGTYGVIAEMNARYVVMRPRNSADILIPNETLLTTQVVNWSYRSRAVRQAIKVGVSYSTDMEAVAQIMIDAVKDHPRVLERPGVRCFIVEFGDSSVNFEVRFWMNDPENGVNVLKGELYMRVWKALQENKIEIPFPQRVVHMAK